MKSIISAVMLVAGAFACASQAEEVRTNNAKSSCESSCMQGRDQCASTCGERAAAGQNPDNASCSTACDDAKKSCIDKCHDD